MFGFSRSEYAKYRKLVEIAERCCNPDGDEGFDWDGTPFCGIGETCKNAISEMKKALMEK